MKKYLLILGTFVLLSLFVFPVFADEDNRAEVQHHKVDEVFPPFVQDYLYSAPTFKGPACYYKKDVQVVYTFDDNRVIITKDDFYKKHVTRHGTAEIFDLSSGDLLDTKGFQMVEKTDYRYSDNDPPVLESSTYKRMWKIPGVYDFRNTIIDGAANWGYRSGDCSYNWPVH